MLQSSETVLDDVSTCLSSYLECFSKVDEFFTFEEDGYLTKSIAALASILIQNCVKFAERNVDEPVKYLISLFKVWLDAAHEHEQFKTLVNEFIETITPNIAQLTKENREGIYSKRSFPGYYSITNSRY